MGIVKEGLSELPGGKLVYEMVSDHAEVHNENDELKKDPQRGFSELRHIQRIGRVPADIWHAHCKKIGWNNGMDNETRKKELIKFLNQFRGWATVESIRSDQPSEGHIIIK